VRTELVVQIQERGRSQTYKNIFSLNNKKNIIEENIFLECVINSINAKTYKSKRKIYICCGYFIAKEIFIVNIFIKKKIFETSLN
jgi:hypothetical protein